MIDNRQPTTSTRRMSSNIVRQRSEKSNSTIDERALIDQFCANLLPKKGDSDVCSVSGASDFTLISSASDVTLRSSNTAVSQNTSDDNSRNLVMKWSTKEQLIAILNEYSATLHGKALDNERQFLDKTNKLLHMLNGLPMRVKETIKETWEKLDQLNIHSTSGQTKQGGFDVSGNCEFCNRPLSQPDLQPKKCAKCDRVTYCSDQCENEDRSFHLGDCGREPGAENNTVESANHDLLLDLKWKARAKIIETLTMNQAYAIYNSRYVSAESKKNLIRKNNVLIQMLIGLAPRLVDSRRIGYLFPEEENEDEEKKEEKKADEEKAEERKEDEVKANKVKKNEEKQEKQNVLADTREIIFEIKEFSDLVKDRKTLHTIRLDHATRTGLDWKLEYWNLSTKIVDEGGVEYLFVSIHSSGRPIGAYSTLTLIGKEMSNGLFNKRLRLPNCEESKEVYVKFCTLEELKKYDFILNDSIKIRVSYPDPEALTT